MDPDHDSCCTEDDPCNEGEGDCDADSHCAGDLKCGTDNCQKFTKEAGATSDCCYEENTIIINEGIM